MRKCINCKEIELTNPKAMFCSDRCRMQHKRTNNPNKEKPEQDNPNTRTLSIDGTYDRDVGDVVVPDGVFTRLMARAKPGHVRVSKPGDADYKPLCEFTEAWCDANNYEY